MRMSRHYKDMSEAALKNLSEKEEFLADFVKRCSIKPDCVFQGLRVTYDYTKHERVDAIVLTSKRVYLFEIVTWTGRYRLESDTTWVREEKVDGIAGQAPPTAAALDGTNTQSLVTVMATRVTNPVIEGRRKMKALKQYVESKIGPRGSSDFTFYVLFIKEECVLSEDCLADRRVVSYSQLDTFMHSFEITWGRWFAEWYPWWPVWISSYKSLKDTLEAVPRWDVVFLNSGTKLYGELRSCSGVPYDRQTTSELRFVTKKAGLLIGREGITAKAIKRNSTSELLRVQLEDVHSTLDFTCVDADTPTSIKLTDIDKVIISRPLT